MNVHCTPLKSEFSVQPVQAKSEQHTNLQQLIAYNIKYTFKTHTAFLFLNTMFQNMSSTRSVWNYAQLDSTSILNQAFTSDLMVDRIQSKEITDVCKVLTLPFGMTTAWAVKSGRSIPSKSPSFSTSVISFSCTQKNRNIIHSTSDSCFLSWLPPQKTVLLAKLIVLQLGKKFLTLYRMQRSIIMSVTACHLSVSAAR